MLYFTRLCLCLLFPPPGMPFILSSDQNRPVHLSRPRSSATAWASRCQAWYPHPHLPLPFPQSEMVTHSWRARRLWKYVLDFEEGCSKANVPLGTGVLCHLPSSLSLDPVKSLLKCHLSMRSFLTPLSKILTLVTTPSLPLPPWHLLFNIFRTVYIYYLLSALPLDYKPHKGGKL